MSGSNSTELPPETSESPFAQVSWDQDSRPQSGERARVGGHPLLWSWIGLLTFAGILGVSPELGKLWEIWMTDPLRSIGIFILPTSIVLTLLVWRQCGWELRGTWWGLLPVAWAFAPLILSRQLVFFWAAGGVQVNFLPYVLPVYLYAAGIVLLFAGARVWRQAWFPLALLLLLQPVPQVAVRLLDLPMQELSAHIARSFALLLGLSPSNSELLGLMFTPGFGMFIAPGCDGMRGAITMGYGALIVGYLKRVSVARWAGYVAGALLLGHVFNLLRLCALVLYYRIAIGHPGLESIAKQADYVIGALLFLVAAFLFLCIVRRKENREIATSTFAGSMAKPYASVGGLIWKAAALTPLVLAAIMPAAHAMTRNPETLALAVRRGEITAQDLKDRLPSQVGAYKLVRAEQEKTAGAPVLETADFESASSDEIEIGIWLPPTDHSIQISLKTQGEAPKMRAIEEFATAHGRTVPFSTALYDDGITDTLTGDTNCSPFYCQVSEDNQEGIHLAIVKKIDHGTRGKRAVPIFFKMQVLHTGAPTEAVYKELSVECQDFLSRLDLSDLSRRFQ